MLLLWFILIVYVRPLSVCLWQAVQFNWDGLLAICWERVVLFTFRLYCFHFVPSYCTCSIPVLVFRAGCGIWLYRFLIIAFSSTFHYAEVQNRIKIQSICYMRELRNTPACWVLNYCLEVCLYIKSAGSEWYICLQMTDKIRVELYWKKKKKNARLKSMSVSSRRLNMSGQ